MASGTMKLSIHLSWWVGYYLAAVRLFCETTGMEPDIVKVTEFVVRHGMRIDILSHEVGK